MILHPNGLQAAFYIVAIIFMGLGSIVMLGALIGILIVRSKVKSVQNSVKSGFELFGGWTKKGKSFLQAFKQGMSK